MRRILAALLLVGCLLFALIPAAAAKERSFRDLDDIQNRSQVMFLVDLGMISGYADNTFRPKATISRAETAKLISLLYTDTIAAAKEETPAPFPDIAGHWAEAAIRFCAQEGILAGNGDGTFRPGDPVTARELAKMLLITVGGDASRYVGENWDDAVDDDAAAQGIYTRFTKDPSLPVNRDDACLLIYNAMQGLAIEGYDEDGNVEYVMDALRNPISFLEARFGLTRYTGVVTGTLSIAQGAASIGMTAKGMAAGEKVSESAFQKSIDESTGFGTKPIRGEVAMNATLDKATAASTLARQHSDIMMNARVQSFNSIMSGSSGILGSIGQCVATMYDAELKESEAAVERIRAQQQQLESLDESLKALIQKALSSQDAIQQNMNQTRTKILG